MKQPKTSLEAYKAVTLEMKNNHWSKIIKALKSLGSGTYEEVSDYVGMDKHQVGRRVKEMELEGLIYKSGLKRPTKSGRNAYVYHVVGSMQPKTEKKVNFENVRTIPTDHAKKIIQLTQGTLL